jgi:3-methyladenine DNA glycosylase/8-oxoguanine DNA glycosylase
MCNTRYTAACPIMPTTLYIEIPKDFSFRATVYSHGWCELAPFSVDAENWRLSYVFSDGKSVTPSTMYEEKKKLRIDLANGKIKPEKIIRDVRHILRLDDDLTGFYAAVADDERLAWVTHRRAGRMLRSPTVWEDLVKTMCTTNCSWALTKIMVNNLVAKLGTKGSFPTAKAMAKQDEAFYRAEIKAGYRAPYFMELAEKVSSGELEPERWVHSELATSELKKEMKKVKGVGDYAAENLLKLVGRYDGLALDSWLRSQFYKNHNKGKACKDIKIERHYIKYGEWRGLVIWCDMTEKWHA